MVAINRFPEDTDAELEIVRRRCAEMGANVALSEVWAKGGEGGIELAKEVIRIAAQPNNFRLVYDDQMPLKEKIITIAREIYGADGVDFLPAASANWTGFTALGYGSLPVCIAKTQYSFSDDPSACRAADRL